MKSKTILTIGILIAVVFMGCETWKSEYSIEDLNVSIKSSKAGNIFYEDGTLSLTIEINNPNGRELDADLTIEIRDYYNKTYREKILVKLKPNGYTYILKFYPERKGIYYLSYRLECEGFTKTGSSRFGVVSSNIHKLNSQIGVGIYMHKFRTESKEQSAELAERAGVKWIREGFSWHSIEKDKGVFDWREADERVKIAKKYNLSIVGMINMFRVPDWAKSSICESIPQKEQDRANFIFTLVSRYKDEIKYWEIGNEPNNYPRYCPSYTAKVYAQALKVAYKAVKKACPDCKVLIGGLGAGAFGGGDNLEKLLPWLRDFYSAGKDWFDIMCIHPYDKKSPYGSVRKVKILLDFMEKEGDERKIWITEVGGYPVLNDEWTELKQAAWLVQLYTLLLSQERVEKVFWFRFADLPGQKKYNGLLREDFTPRLSYFALSTLSNKLAGKQFVKKLDIEGVEAYLFEENDEECLVLWSSEGGKKITLPEGLDCFDIMGNPIERRDIAIRETPLFLVGKGIEEKLRPPSDKVLAVFSLYLLPQYNSKYN
jgi:hypothetical protein